VKPERLRVSAAERLRRANPVPNVPSPERRAEMPRTQKAPEQVQFEGLRVMGKRFQLKGTTDLTTDQDLSIGDIVAGEFKGRVVGIHHDQTKEGALFRKHVIEVDGGSID
jgi:hypothetical protein